MLKSAKRLLIENGRTKGQMVNEAGQYCMLGAIAEACGLDVRSIGGPGRHWEQPLFKAVRFRFGDYILDRNPIFGRHYGGGITCLNDTSTDEVAFGVMDKAIEAFESNGVV